MDRAQSGQIKPSGRLLDQDAIVRQALERAKLAKNLINKDFDGSHYGEYKRFLVLVMKN